MSNKDDRSLRSFPNLFCVVSHPDSMRLDRAAYLLCSIPAYLRKDLPPAARRGCGSCLWLSHYPPAKSRRRHIRRLISWPFAPPRTAAASPRARRHLKECWTKYCGGHRSIHVQRRRRRELHLQEVACRLRSSRSVGHCGSRYPSMNGSAVAKAGVENVGTI